jgi:putative oxidoreductase
MKDIADLIARILLAIFFLYEGLDAILFFDNNLATMESYGITFLPKLLLVLGIIELIFGGLMVLTGYYANIGAILLLLYRIPFTFFVYDFWNDPPDLQRLSSLNFMLNVAIIGGLLLLVANGAKKYSIKRLIHVMRLPS